MNDELVKKGLDIIDQIIQGLKEAAPQMVDLTLAAVKLQAVVSLGVTIVWGLIAVAIIVLAVKLFRFFKGKAESASDPFNYTLAGVLTLPLSLLVLLTPSIIFLSNLFNTYMWAALVDPRVALAMRALDKVLTVTNTK